MFGLINCEHKGFVGFEFDDYPEDIFDDVRKSPSSTQMSDLNSGITNENGVIRIWKSPLRNSRNNY